MTNLKDIASLLLAGNTEKAAFDFIENTYMKLMGEKNWSDYVPKADEQDIIPED